MPVIEDLDPLAQLHDELHVMFDEENGKWIFTLQIENKLSSFQCLAWIHSRHGFVQQEKPGTDGQRPRNLEPALLSVGERPRPFGTQVWKSEFLEVCHRLGFEQGLLTPVRRQAEHSLPEM